MLVVTLAVAFISPYRYLLSAVVNSAPPPPMPMRAEAGLPVVQPPPELSEASWIAPSRSLESVRPRVPLFASYLMSQCAAGVATFVDFVLMVLLVERIGVHYVVATALGAFAGGATAFIANRHWSFRAGHRRIGRQALRYTLVWFGSISLNCLLVFLMTDQVGFGYILSKSVTAVLVGACFNFPLHRHYVFR
jgi:putative flippase GtrA